MRYNRPRCSVQPCVHIYMRSSHYQHYKVGVAAAELRKALIDRVVPFIEKVLMWFR